MARTPRYSIPGQPHHVIQRGNNRMTIFTAEDDFHFFYDSLRTSSTRFACQIHAYVFMTNHVHLLLTPPDARAMGTMMLSLGRRYAGYFNRRYARTGTLFEGRYRASVIDSDSYLLSCYRYIEENPVRAGLARDPSAYRWSSYRANALGVANTVVTQHDRFLSLGRTSNERRSAYRALFRTEIESFTVRSLRFAINSGRELSGAIATNSFIG
jgi:putative transposase